MRLHNKIKMTVGQKVKLVLVVGAFAGIVAGFIAVSRYADDMNVSVIGRQESMAINDSEARAKELSVRCTVKQIDTTRLYGRSVKYNVTVYNNTDKEVKTWSIAAKMKSAGKVDSETGVTCKADDNRVFFLPSDRYAHIDVGKTATFDFDLETARSSVVPILKNVVIRAETEVSPSELPAFWLLVISAVIWLVCAVSYIIGVYAYRKRMRQHEMDSEVIFQTIYTFTSFIDAKDAYTRGHSVRVAYYAREIAAEMHLPNNDIENIYYCGLLHDAGKISVPDDVLNKPGKLNEAEFQLIKNHTTNGARMLRRYTAIDGIKETALYHHERYDGKGYPTGIKRKAIPLYARIVCVADSYDAMSSNRVYRKQLDNDTIVTELEKCSGTQFDPDIVPFMVHMIRAGIADELRRNADELAF